MGLRESRTPLPLNPAPFVIKTDGDGILTEIQPNLPGETTRRRAYKLSWISELELKATLCNNDGWPFGHNPDAKAFLLSMWPQYTPRKGYEQEIYALQRELGITPTYPRHINICPMTNDQGKAINAKFEEVAGL